MDQVGNAASSCYFCETMGECGSIVELAEDETHHLIHVSRITHRQTITLLDGKGSVAYAKLERINSKRASLQILQLEYHKPQKPSLNLAVAVTRNEVTFDTILKSASEFGVNSIIPLITEHSGSARIARKASRNERWNRIVRNTCKQARSVWFPMIDDLTTIDDFLQRCCTPESILLVGTEPAHIANANARIDQILGCSSLYWAVGPEGGWTNFEYTQLSQLGVEISFGSTVLKTPTASIAGLCVLRFLLNNRLN